MSVRTAAPLALIVVSLVGCGKGQGQAPQPPEVMVAQVLSQKITDWDEYTGRFQAIDTVEVRPRVSGYIDQVQFREGQPVKKGETLIVIDPRPYQADFDRAKAGLALAKAQRELATLEAERVHRLKDSGAVSQEEFDERLSALHQQEASVAGAQAEYDAAALNLSFTKVTAPIDGQASRAEITRGNLVTGGNNGGTLLTTIVSTDPMYVYFDGDEHAYLRYNQLARAGERPSSRTFANPVRVGLANEEGFPHEGHMDFVDNQLNVRTGTIRGRAVLDNKGWPVHPGHVRARAAARHLRARGHSDRGARDRYRSNAELRAGRHRRQQSRVPAGAARAVDSGSAHRQQRPETVSYTHLRAHETPEHLVCRL